MKSLTCVLLMGGMVFAGKAQAQSVELTPTQNTTHPQIVLLREQKDCYHSEPARALQSMGLDALPILADALEDTTPTKMVKDQFEQSLSVRAGSGPQYIKVNEVAATLITRITEHTFVLGEASRENVLLDVTKNPRLAPDFRKLVLDWYVRNRDKSIAERKMQDITDPWFRNRIDAAKWIGTHKLTAGRSLLEHYIETLLARNAADTTADTELTFAVHALGQIKDKASLPLVQRVYNRFHGYAEDTDSMRSYYRNYIESDKMPLVTRSLTLLGGRPGL